MAQFSDRISSDSPSRSICIYCLQETNDWSTEHVMPRMFGTFQPNAPTLTKQVCKTCNNVFSKTEGEIAHESFESWARNLTGLKAPIARSGHLKNVRARFKNGMLAGAAYSPIPEHEIAQIGLKRKSGEGYQYFTLEEFRRLSGIDHEQFEVFEPKSVTILVGGSENDRDEALKEIDRKFHNLGLASGENRKMNPIREGSSINLSLRFSIPREVLRIYAKLAFNHLAFITSADFVRNSTFDYFRDFVRHGCESPERPLGVIRIREPELNAKVAANAMRRHILATGLTNLGSDISGLVVLFDTLLIKFKLCRFSPIARYPGSVAVGTSHTFDVQQKTVRRGNLPPEFTWLA